MEGLLYFLYIYDSEGDSEHVDRNIFNIFNNFNIGRGNASF